MRKFVTIAAVMALATAQAGAVAAPVQTTQSATSIGTNSADSTAQPNRRRRREAAIILSLTALSALILGIIAVKNGNNGGGRPASP